MRQFLFLPLFLLMLVQQTNAQDAIAVSKEPLHKNVFENQYVVGHRALRKQTVLMQEIIRFKV